MAVAIIKVVTTLTVVDMAVMVVMMNGVVVTGVDMVVATGVDITMAIHQTLTVVDMVDHQAVDVDVEAADTNLIKGEFYYHNFSFLTKGVNFSTFQCDQIIKVDSKLVNCHFSYFLAKSFHFVNLWSTSRILKSSKTF